jgi:2-hydroxy-6-oxonona-2,4-dienedioate hydrolase
VNFDRLARRFHVIAFDKLGCGQTGNPSRDEEFTMAGVVAHARRFMELLGVRNATLWGHSRGALAALRLAIEAPELCGSLVMTNSNSAAPEDPSVPRGFYTRFYPAEDAAATPESLCGLFRALAFDPASVPLARVVHSKQAELLVPHPDRPNTSEAIRRMLERKRRFFDASFLEYKYETLEKVRIGGLRARTLVLWGFNDPSVPARVGFELYQRIALYVPGTEFHVVNRAGHYPHMEQADAVERALAAFTLAS